uniref:Uncharacterized protein n=1 Tax=Kalanchoe fedtschenkoi TaxID=63787 RepID=A0A7N0UCA2_KALFE
MLNPGPMTKNLMEKTLDSSREPDVRFLKSLKKIKVCQSQATAYAKFAEAAAKARKNFESEYDKQYDDSGLLSVLPASAESAGLLPKHEGSLHGSYILLEAIIEAEVAQNAKDFFSQPQNQIPCDRE